MTLNDAIDLFEDNPSVETFCDLVIVAEQYLSDEQIEESSFDHIVNKARKTLYAA
jgi:hypothetical protein